jgi:hypothetical protein
MFWGVRSILGGNEEQKNAKYCLLIFDCVTVNF